MSSNTNCVDCVNCIGCVNCVRCVNCIDCVDCIDSTYLMKCSTISHGNEVININGKSTYNLVNMQTIYLDNDLEMIVCPIGGNILYGRVYKINKVNDDKYYISNIFTGTLSYDDAVIYLIYGRLGDDFVNKYHNKLLLNVESNNKKDI